MSKISTCFPRSLSTSRPPTSSHNGIALALCVLAIALGSTSWAVAGEKKADDATARIRNSVKYLADDARQGRGPGTKGLDQATDYIKEQFTKLKLKTDLCDGQAYQTFTIRTTPANGQRQQIDWLSALAQAGLAKQSNNGTNGQTDKRPTQPVEKPRSASVKAKIKNVVASLEGTGPHAAETIVIGAHYDHLGQYRNEQGKWVVFNGANDNASGTAALIEIARTLANRKEKLPRRIVFVAFSGEELGLLGSLYYVDHPAVPLADTVAMINLDMVGNLEHDSLIAMGTGCSPMLAKTATDTAKQHGIQLVPVPFSMPCSDHSPFHAAGVPIIFFATTGGFGDYHTPADTVDRINHEGIKRVAQMTSDLAVTLAQSDKRPEFVNEGFSATLLRGAVRLLGRAARRMASEPEQEKVPANKDGDAQPSKK